MRKPVRQGWPDMGQQPAYTAEQLWRKFALLTDEMIKFLAKNDVDEFLELQAQRDRFECMIKEQEDTGFIKSVEGQEFLKRLIFLNKGMHISVQRWLNGTRNQRNITNSYESLGRSLSGWRIDGRL